MADKEESKDRSPIIYKIPEQDLGHKTATYQPTEREQRIEPVKQATISSPTIQVLNKISSDIQSSVFDMPSMPSISQPAIPSLSEAYITKQIELEQERLESRLERLKEGLRAGKEEKKESVKEAEENLVPSVREPHEIVEKVEELVADMEGVMEVVEKIKIVNETGRVLSERTVARYRRTISDIEDIIERASKYGVEKEEVVDRLSKIVRRCKIPSIKEQLKDALEEARAPDSTKESIAAGLGRIVAEEMERIAEMQKQSATDRRKVATKIRKVLDERKGYEDAMKDLLGLVDKARSMGEKLGKEDILKELVRIAGRCKTGIGRDLQDIITEARKEERRKEDILSDIREAAGSFVRKLAVIEAVQKLLPRAAELERQDLIDKMQRIVSQWRKEEQSLEAVEREMLKMIEKGIGDEEFKKKAKELLKGKPDIEREVLKLKPDAAVAYVRGIVRELQSNEHIQELKDMISSPLSRDELITEINSIVKGESEAVALSRRITSILRKADDPRVGTQDLIKQLKEASRLAEESELNIKLREILAKTERMGMSKEFLVSRLREISSLHERQLEVATEISAIVVASERMTKKELIENLKRITSACRREADFFETAFKNLKKLLFKRPSSEEFFSRMDDELRGREWAVRDVKRRKLTPGQAIEMFREIAEGLKSNPYVRRLDSIIDREKALQKTEIINALKELDKEIQQTKRIITELSNLVGAHDREVEEVEKEARAGKVVGVSSLSREDILLAVESLARSTSSDRLGRKLQRITDRARKEGMSRDDIIHEIIRMLPTENNFLTIFSRLRWALENDDIKELNRLMGMLYRVNFEILSIDITVKKYMAQDGKGAAQEQASKAAIADTARKVLHKISILSHKEEEREAGIFVDGILRRLVDEPDAVERGRLINLLIDTCASSRPSIRRIMAVKLERFLRGPYSSVSSILSSIPNSCVPRVARLCLNDKDLSAKAASTKLLSRYFDMLSEHAWRLNPDIISRHIDESVNAIVIGGVAGPESLKMSALNALKKVAVRNKNAALAIKILAKDRSENVSSAAKEIIKDLML